MYNIQLKDNEGNKLFPATKSENVSFENNINGMRAINIQEAVEENNTDIVLLKETNGDLKELFTSDKTNLVSAVNEVFQFASSGKAKIASAVTGKGIITNNTDSFQTIANNINKIKTGINVNIDDKSSEFDFNLTSKRKEWTFIQEELPFEFFSGPIVVLNNEIHVLGAINPDYTRSHYKYNGKQWVYVSTLPYDIGSNGTAIAFNGEIHIIGGNNHYIDHYKYNGTEWVFVTNIPCLFMGGTSVVWNDEIHLLGGMLGGDFEKHCKFDGESWTNVSTLPYDYVSGYSAVWNNEIHLISGGWGDSDHYKYDGNSWVSVGDLPYHIYCGQVLLYDDKIHMLGDITNEKAHYIFNGISWDKVPEELPYNFCSGLAAILDNEIHLIGNYESCSHYKWVTLYELTKNTLL